MTETIFSVGGLRIEREQVILQDINWQVQAGEHWVILGANGSGKTSLLRALTGYLMPTRGEIQIGPARYGATDWREVRRMIGLVSNSLGHQIEPEQRAAEVVLSGKIAHINHYGKITPEQQKWLRKMMRQLRAEKLAERPWAYLSQGERQRILIGRALASQPRLLFLDEPCAGLDPVAREHFLEFLGKLAHTPQAPNLVLITHHVEEILPCFGHVLLLRHGRLLAQGPRDEMMTSKLLSETFGADIELNELKRQNQARYQIAIAPSPSARSF